MIGVDVSEDMIKTAKESSKSDSIEFHISDGQELQHWLTKTNNQGKFDKVFSNAAIHWMNRDPASVARGMFDALKPGGILAIE